MKKLTPFHVRGKIKFPWKPTADRVFVYPCPPSETYIPGGHIVIPDAHREFYFQGIGVVLAVGPGFFDNKGKWRGMPTALVPGVFVKYDQTVPWRQIVIAPDGKEYAVVLCGAADISGVVEFDE